MTKPDPISQNQTPELVSIWRRSATGAVALTLLASCVMAINVHNPIEALGNLLFSVPITFFVRVGGLLVYCLVMASHAK